MMMTEEPLKATYGMSSVERVLLTATGVIMFAITAWTLDRVILNTGKIAVLEQRVQYHDAAIDRFYVELREHRAQTERNTRLENDR